MIGSGVGVRRFGVGVTQDIRMMYMYYCSKFEMTTELHKFHDNVYMNHFPCTTERKVTLLLTNNLDNMHAKVRSWI